ncbi:hypothetical protein PYCC9005_002716 [Savitreella phatthalungensis]
MLSSIDLVPTTAAVTSRLVSSLVITGVLDSFIGSLLAVFAFLLSTLVISASQKPAKRPPSIAASATTNTRRGRSGYDNLDGIKAGLQAEAEEARKAVTARTSKAVRSLQALLGGPGSRRSDKLNNLINLVLLALVARQAINTAIAARSARDVGFEIQATGLTTQSATIKLSSDTYTQLRLKIPKAHFDRCIDLPRSRLPVSIALGDLRHGTAYEWQIAPCDVSTEPPHIGEFRTQLLNMYDTEGRCTTGLAPNGGRTTREVLHNTFLNSLCGPPGGRSLLLVADDAKKAIIRHWISSQERYSLLRNKLRL